MGLIHRIMLEVIKDVFLNFLKIYFPLHICGWHAKICQQTARRKFWQATDIFPKIIKLIDISLVYLLEKFGWWESISGLSAPQLPISAFLTMMSSKMPNEVYLFVLTRTFQAWFWTFQTPQCNVYCHSTTIFTVRKGRLMMHLIPVTNSKQVSANEVPTKSAKWSE